MESQSYSMGGVNGKEMSSRGNNGGGSCSGGRVRGLDVALRVLALALTLVAAVVLGVDKQTEVLPVQLIPSLPPLNVPVSAKWHYMSAFVYFVVVNAIACAYAAGSLLVSLADRGGGKKGLSPVIILLDLIMAALLFTANGATAAVGILGYKGNSHLRWDKVCNVFGKFCGQVAAALVISLVGSAVFLLMIMVATLNLHRRK